MRIRTPLLALALAAACAPRAGLGPTTSHREITADLVLAHDRYLASDELEGRGVGTRGIELAAKYIADDFAKSGLEPAGIDGFFQPFEMTVGVRVGSNDELALTAATKSSAFPIDRDWRPLEFS